MPSNISSTAVLAEDRVLPQHQAALTLLKDRAESPGVTQFRWLDVACGRGQVLSTARTVLGACKGKIEWVGVDVNEDRARYAQKQAEELFGPARATLHICDIERFEAHLGDAMFDFVTFTNSAHEITPKTLANTFVSMLCRASADGDLYMYDMESLPELELGAIPWTAREIHEIAISMTEPLGCAMHLPDPSVWKHRSCNGWSMHLNRRHLPCSTEVLAASREEMVKRAAVTIQTLLRRKLVETHRRLDVLSRFPASSPDEALDASRWTYDHWAICRALSGPALLGSGD